MSSQELIFRDYSLREIDLLPPEDEPHDPAEDQWADYCEMSQRLDVDNLAAVVAEELRESPILHTLIREVLDTPFRPGERPHFHVNDMLRLGDALAAMIQRAADDQVGMQEVSR